MPLETGAASVRGLVLVVHSGCFDKVHYALAMASAAAAVGRGVVLFFTNDAVRAVCAGAGKEAAGWPSLPARDGSSGDARNAANLARGIAGFEELLGACRDLGVVYMVCEMGMRAAGIDRKDLRQDIPITEGGLATLLLDAADDNIIFL